MLGIAVLLISNFLFRRFVHHPKRYIMKTKNALLILGLLLASIFQIEVQAQTTKPLVLNRSGTRYYAGFTYASTVLSNGTTVIVGSKVMDERHSQELGFVTFNRSDGSLIRELLVGEGNLGGSKIKGVLAEPGTNNVYVIGSTILQTGKYKSQIESIVIKCGRISNLMQSIKNLNSYNC